LVGSLVRLVILVCKLPFSVVSELDFSLQKGPSVRPLVARFVVIAEIDKSDKSDKSNKPANLTNLTESDKSLSAILS